MLHFYTVLKICHKTFSIRIHLYLERWKCMHWKLENLSTYIQNHKNLLKFPFFKLDTAYKDIGLITNPLLVYSILSAKTCCRYFLLIQFYIHSINTNSVLVIVFNILYVFSTVTYNILRDLEVTQGQTAVTKHLQ